MKIYSQDDATFRRKQAEAGPYGICKLQQQDPQSGQHTVLINVDDKVIEGTVGEIAELLPEESQQKFKEAMGKFSPGEGLPISENSGQMYAYFATAVNFIFQHLSKIDKTSISLDFLSKIARGLEQDGESFEETGEEKELDEKFLDKLKEENKGLAKEAVEHVDAEGTKLQEARGRQAVKEHSHDVQAFVEAANANGDASTHKATPHSTQLGKENGR